MMEPTPTGPDVERLIVPEDLMRKLHEANERFHEGKARLEKAMESDEYNHTKHVEQEVERLRKTETEIEELQRQVQEILNRRPTE